MEWYHRIQKTCEAGEICRKTLKGGDGDFTNLTSFLFPFLTVTRLDAFPLFYYLLIYEHYQTGGGGIALKRSLPQEDEEESASGRLPAGFLLLGLSVSTQSRHLQAYVLGKSDFSGAEESIGRPARTLGSWKLKVLLSYSERSRV